MDDQKKGWGYRTSYAIGGGFVVLFGATTLALVAAACWKLVVWAWA